MALWCTVNRPRTEASRINAVIDHAASIKGLWIHYQQSEQAATGKMYMSKDVESWPVIRGACIIVVVAGCVASSELANALPTEEPVVCENNLALVIHCAVVEVVAGDTDLRDAYADAKVSQLRVYFHAEPRPQVALAEIELPV
jgi:hypothetical protein